MSLLAVLLLTLVVRGLCAPGPGGERSDEDLFAAHVRGDPDAFRLLWERYAEPLARFVGRGVRRREDVHDVVQQAFLHLHRARHDFRPGAALRPWLYTIALNLRHEHFRKLGRRRESAEPLDEERHPTVAPPDPTARETAARVRAALARLPDGQREVIELHWLHELPFPEVADIVGVSLSAVKVRAHRGYKLLRVELEGERP